jgi:hypothetical protein
MISPYKTYSKIRSTKHSQKKEKNFETAVFGDCLVECGVAGERLDRGQKCKKVRILEKVIGRSFSSHHLSTLGF